MSYFWWNWHENNFGYNKSSRIIYLSWKYRRLIYLVLWEGKKRRQRTTHHWDAELAWVLHIRGGHCCCISFSVRYLIIALTLLSNQERESLCPSYFVYLSLSLPRCLRCHTLAVCRQRHIIIARRSFLCIYIDISLCLVLRVTITTRTHPRYVTVPPDTSNTYFYTPA